jgi:hypothetical protein
MQKCIEALSGFNKLASTNLPFKQTYVVAKNIKSLEEVVSTFEKHRNEYIKTLKENSFDQDGKQTVSDEDAEKFKKDIEDLLSEKVKISIDTVSLSDEGFDGITATDIKGCIDFISMEE